MVLAVSIAFGSIPGTVFASGKDASGRSNSSDIGEQTEDTYFEQTYVNDTPIRLQVSKVKTAVGDHEGLVPGNAPANGNSITYRMSGRVDGAEAELIKQYGAKAVELAYSSSGTYLGYGWLTGTLEYLLNRQEQSLKEEIQIIYNEYGVFDGYGYITRTLETANDVNRYVAGAKLALYDAVEVSRSPNKNGADDRFIGVTVERAQGSNNVTSVYVDKGYAGTQIKYVLQKEDGNQIEVDANGTIINKNYNYQDEINDKGHGTWIAQTVQRENTPILFYSLDNLRITSNDVYTSVTSQNNRMIDDIYGAERFDKDRCLYGFDREGNVVNITQKDETDFSIFAFEASSNRPIYEFVGGDFTKIRYHLSEKTIELGPDTIMYHLDAEGQRDALVDSMTGIAYIEEPVQTSGGSDTKCYVWPVNTYYDGSGGIENGARTFRKIITTRIATINADTADEYSTGTYDGKSFTKSQSPVLDAYGHPVYYRKSDQVYTKGEDTYDYDGDEYTGYVYKDSLDAENENAYIVNDHDTLYNGDDDDPFDQSTHYQYAKTQSIMITVDMENNYLVDGKSAVPVPVRSGYVFAGWLIEPNQVTEGSTIKAYWRNRNSSGMNEEEKEQWYSDRSAASTQIKTMKVTFDANGGEFRNGSGDIHSTDNILYRRLGDAYLLENVWISGEHTPNDPFDVQKVDTIENVASGENTISQIGETGNDVYSLSKAGGQADMLKRINQGSYIMEEQNAAAGFTRGFPVGVTVKESTDVQVAEMTDKTIKTEFIKIDATGVYDKDLYINGILQKNDAGTSQKVSESKGSWSYRHVTGAILSLKAKDTATKKSFSDWVKVTQNSQITKKISGNYHYFEFSSDTPLFVEGLPKGNYVLSEVVVPPGMVKMPDQPITITGTDDVQIFTMKDDHTKIEIEKYYNDGGNKNMPNAYRAELTLNDEKGEVVSTWLTDDMTDYTSRSTALKKKTVWERAASFLSPNPKREGLSFVELFTEKVNDGDTTFSTISWNVSRVAEKASYSTNEKEVWIVSDGSRVECLNQTAPDDAPQAFKDAYAVRGLEDKSFTYQETMTATKDIENSRNLSDQIWEVSNGSKMHVSVYGDNGQSVNGRQAYIVDFKFNFRDDYTGRYINTVSYDTIDGKHRFDYLPAGVFQLIETKTPEGFVTASNQMIKVEESEDIQRFTIENKKKQLIIEKIAKNKDYYYTGQADNKATESQEIEQAAVIAGAELALYYSENPIPEYITSFLNGQIPAGASLADQWTSGEDGVYTEAEYRAEIIRQDQVGDYRPHTVRNVKNGWYYLVEQSTPAYYKSFEPMEIHVTDHASLDTLVVKAINSPIPMEVRVYKKNTEDSPLAGAVFEVRNKTLGGILVGTLTTDSTGYASLTVPDIGRFSKEGVLEPYVFTVQEISSPPGYELDLSIHEFKAAPGHNQISTIIENKADEDIINGTLYVTNKPSQITISKSDFSDGGAVPGTKLAIYEAVLEDGVWKNTKISKSDDWTWTIQNGQYTHTVTGLAASSTYVLTEEAVPAGYTKAKDIFFRVSANGNAIEKVWYDPQENVFITFELDKTGAVDSVTFQTRTLLGTYVTLRDLDNDTVINKGTLTDGEIHLSSQDVVEGHQYLMKEYVQYSDGTEDCLGTTTFIAKLNKDWMKLDLSSSIRDLTIDLSDQYGENILSFQPSSSGSYTVQNPLLTDSNQLTVVGSLLDKIGVDHKAVPPGKQIRYQITCAGKEKEIILYPVAGLRYLSLDGMIKHEDGTYRVITAKESNTYTIIAKIENQATGYINQQISIDGNFYSYLNPIAVNAGEGNFYKTSKLVISSAVAGTHLGNENADFTFKVTLTSADGSPLPGAYDYRTMDSNGKLNAYESETSFEITVKGNDFIVIRDLPYNTQYQVVQVVSAKYDFTVTNTQAAGKTKETEISNILFTNTRNESTLRSVFKKNTGYVLTEKLNFTDDSMRILNKFGFSFGDKCEIKDIMVFNRKTEVHFAKLDWTDTEELPGATCILMDADGNILLDEFGNELRWISGTTPKIITGVLEAGKTYRYHEEFAPSGYGYSEDVVFTVSEDGTIDKVVMIDKPNTASFVKEDFAGAELPGAHCELKVVNPDGSFSVIDSWVSSTTPHRITGKLESGKTYHFHEAFAPSGYSYAEDIIFEVGNDGKIVRAHYLLNGIQIPVPVIDNVIRMKDQPLEVSFVKEDFNGNTIAGVHCKLEIIQEDGSTKLIDQWISSHEPHRNKQLSADEKYRYVEESAAEGYGYSATIEFTINRNGTVNQAYYINQAGAPVLFDADGYVTEIVKKVDGTYVLRDQPIIIDENGNAYKENGDLVAEGVQLYLTTEKNLVRMKDAPTQMRLVKVDTDGTPLKDAKFQILHSDGSQVLAIKDTQILSTEHLGYIKEGEKLIFLSTGSLDGILISGLLNAGSSYQIVELSPPAGFIPGSNRSFTIPYLNQKEPMVIQMRNKPTSGTFVKENYEGEVVLGAQCGLYEVNADGSDTVVAEWISDTESVRKESVLKTKTTYRYRESLAPDGFGHSLTIEFVVDEAGRMNAHYINDDGKTVLYDNHGYPTTIIKHDDGTYTDGDMTITIHPNGDAVDEQGVVHAENVKVEIPVEDNVVIMKDAPTDIRIVKVNESGKAISGGKFQILNIDGSAVSAMKDTTIASTEHDGYIRTGELLIFEAKISGVRVTGLLQAGSEYLMRELNAPESHIPGPDVKFTVPYLNQNTPLEVRIKNQETSATFAKVDFLGESIAGAKCSLYEVHADGTTSIVEQWITSNGPARKNGMLKLGTTYEYHEEVARTGYAFSEAIRFHVNADGVISTAYYINEHKQPVIYDSDGYPTGIIAHEDGSYSHNGTSITINESGNAVDESGEEYAKGVKLEIPIEKNEIRMKDAPTKLRIIKTDMSGKALSGGRFQILNADGTPVIAIEDSQPEEDGSIVFKKGELLIFSATEAGVNITGMLTAGSSYLLRELESPAGFVNGPDVAFEIPRLNQKEPIIVIMKNSPTKAEIIKVSDTGAPLSGAEFEIRDAKNYDVMDYWVSDGKPHVITGLLEVGKEYLLIEQKSPTGFYQSETIRFTLSDDELTSIVVENKPVIIKLMKKRRGQNELLSGGKFSVIRKSDGAIIIPEFDLNKELTITGKLDAGVTYLFREIVPPKGYLKSGDVEFTIPLKDPGIIEIVMENAKKPEPGGGKDKDPQPPTLTIKKYDGVTMKSLPGTEFTISDSNGVYKKVTVGLDGYANVTFDTIGKFSYQETKAADGYKIDDTIYYFEIHKDSHLTHPIANYKNPPRVTITKKDSETGSVIAGVRFVIVNEAGMVVFTGVTDSYGQVTFAPDSYGAYAVRETAVPEEYSISDGYITFTVGKGGVEGETTFFNDKKENPPGQDIPPGQGKPPGRDNPGKRPGIITAEYDNHADAHGSGWYDRDGKWHPFADISQTGDNFPYLFLGVMAFCGLIGLVWIRKRRKKYEKA